LFVHFRYLAKQKDRLLSATMANTTSNNAFTPMPELHFWPGVGATIEGTVGIVANVWLIIAAYKSKDLRANKSNTLIVSVACADFGVNLGWMMVRK
jgi:hypothetical protein